MDSLNGKVLCLFTTGYPFGLQVETFIDSELPVMSSRFETVYIFPTIYETETIQRVLPPNFEVVKLKSDWGKHSSRLFKKNFLFIIKVLTDEFLNSKNKSVFLSNWKKYKNVLLHRLYEAELLASFIQNKKLKDVVYYSYWLNEWTVTLGILKRQKIVNKFISRAHGFDIYEERRADKTIPLRYFQLKMVDKVFSVSKMGQKYLINKNIFPQKIACSYLGVSDRGNNPYKEQVCFKIVSCSNLMPLKRVHLILEALKDITFPVEWVHFGDGEGNLLEQFKEKASKNLPSNVRFDFKGHIPNEEVLMYYKEHTVHLLSF